MSHTARAVRPRAARTLCLLSLALLAWTGVARAGDPVIPCLQPNVAGTVLLPALCDVYGKNGDTMVISDGLPLGTTIVIDPTWHNFFNIVRIPGGVFPGGEIQSFDSILELSMTGTGALVGFNRNLFMQVTATTHSSASNPGNHYQPMDIELISFQGAIFGDPDFDLVTVQSGALAGLFSSGGTELLRQGPPGSPFVVDSFFDVLYQIDFVGAPGSVLDGFAGSTIDTVELVQGGTPWVEWTPGKPCGTTLEPDLLASGPLTVGSQNKLQIVDAPASTATFLVVGFSPLRAPFKGGILGPQTDVIYNLQTDAQGELLMIWIWPVAPVGTQVWVQAWFNQVGATDPFCATPTLVGTSQ